MSQMIAAALALLLASCATPSNESTNKSKNGTMSTSYWSKEKLLSTTCQTGQENKQITGTVWLKTNSKTINGQFNAAVFVKSPNELKLEVSNFLGGTVASINVTADRYEVVRGPGEPLSAAGIDSWAGIPLRWAYELFSGKFPCPPRSSSLVLGEENENLLSIQVRDEKFGSQKYVYKYRKIQNDRNNETQPWPESLHWETQSDREIGHKFTVDFKFDQPEFNTLSPLAWEARSREGTIKIKWKERHRISQD
jgi:hypothetical protein